MNTIDKGQIRSIYGLGRNLGILEPGNKQDTLHQYVYNLTDKTSISSLSYEEADKVIQGMRNLIHIPPARGHREQPGMISISQQKKVWALMYQLQRLSPSDAKISERLRGIVKKTLSVSPPADEPMLWVSAAGGRKLIDAIKSIIVTEEKKAKSKL